MSEAMYGQQDQGQSRAASGPGDRRSDQPSESSDPGDRRSDQPSESSGPGDRRSDQRNLVAGDGDGDGQSEQRLTTSDLADPAGERRDEDASVSGGGADRALFAEDEASSLRERWREVQTAFVDEPRRAVEDADTLVADLMQKLAETFARERSSLEGQWDRSGDVSTEEMRVALQRYRSFFDRLLSA